MTHEDSGTTAVAAVEADIPDPVLTPGGLPDIASETGALDTNAKLVWSMVRFTELDTPLREALHEGEPGYLWSGTLTSQLNDTWPILRNPGGATSEIKLRLKQYLKLTHNMVCVNRGSKPGTRPKRLPLWWVRADWADRFEEFRVVVTWTDVDQEETAPEPDGSGAYGSSDIFDTAPVVDSGPQWKYNEQPAEEAAAKPLLVCDYPGCDAGADGGPFTTDRANTLPMHRRSHEVTNKIIDVTARLLAQGADPKHLQITEIAEAADVHPGTISLRFRRGELIEQAQAHLAGPSFTAPAEPLPPETDESAADWETWAVRALRLAAFADVNGTPVTYGSLEETLRGPFGGANATELLKRLEDSGQLVPHTLTDSRGRGRRVWVAADRDVLDGMYVDGVEIADEDEPVDYAAVLGKLLADYAAKDDVIAAQQEMTAQQAEQLNEQTAKIREAKAELADLREAIRPLLNLAGKVQP